MCCPVGVVIIDDHPEVTTLEDPQSNTTDDGFTEVVSRKQQKRLQDEERRKKEEQTTQVREAECEIHHWEAVIPVLTKHKISIHIEDHRTLTSDIPNMYLVALSVYSTMERKDQGKRGEEEASCHQDLPKNSSSINNNHHNNNHSKPHSRSLNSPHLPLNNPNPSYLPPSSLPPPSLLPLPRLWKALWPPYPLPLPLWTSPPRLPFPLWRCSRRPTALSVRNSGRTRWPDPPYSLTSRNVSHTTSGQSFFTTR